jgi:hypothetical protein
VVSQTIDAAGNWDRKGRSGSSRDLILAYQTKIRQLLSPLRAQALTPQQQNV